MDFYFKKLFSLTLCPFLPSDGAVWAWGYGISLGLGELHHAPIPRRVDTLKQYIAVGVSCGKNHSTVWVLKGDKSKYPQLSSPEKSQVKAKDIEIDQYYPSRCKTCKKEIFSYTDTNDMCIIDDLHDCGPKLANSDESTIAGDESEILDDGAYSNLDPEEEKKMDGGKTNVSNSLFLDNVDSSEASSHSLKTQSRSQHHQASPVADNSSPCDRSSFEIVSDIKSPVSSLSDQSLSQAVSTPEDGEPLPSFASVPDTTLDGSMLYLPTDSSLVENDKADICLGVSVAADDIMIDEKRSKLDSLSSPTESCKIDETIDAKGAVKNKMTSSVQLKMDNPAYTTSVSIDSDDVIWKRQSAGTNDTPPGIVTLLHA